MLDRIVDRLLELPHLSLSAKQKLLVDSAYLADKRFSLLKFIPESELLRLCDNDETEVFKMTHPKSAQVIVDRYREKAGKSAAPSKWQGSFEDIHITPDFPYPLSQCKIIYNMRNLQQSAFYSEPNDCTYDFGWTWIQHKLMQLLGKDGFKDYVAAHSIDAIHLYDPSKPKLFLDDTEAPCWNAYTKPRWLVGFDPSVKRPQPKRFIRFMKHLFPNASARAHVYRWLSAMTFGRAQSILVLCGAPGVGKNVFVETIAAALVGQGNYRCSTRRFESKFHASVSNSRLYFLDEIDLDGSIKEDLKQYYNGSAILERKGVDAERQEKIHASFVLSNNYVSKIKLNESDRKFTVPEITSTRLDKVWEKQEIADFVLSLEDIEVVRDIASLLYCQIGPQVLFDEVYHGDTFKTICNATRPEWFQSVIHLCETQKIVTNRDVRTMNDNRRVSFTKLKDKVIEFEKETGIILGDLESLPKGNYQIISKLYEEEVKTKDLSEEENDFSIED